MTFKLTDVFIDKYKGGQPNWGFDGFGYTIYKRTYARSLPNGESEEWWQTCRRIVEGTYQVQQEHCNRHSLPWNGHTAQRSAQKMFDLIWEFKFTPPGRGLWMMGTKYVKDNGGASLNNCAFVSTRNLNVDFTEPFVFLMDMSMLGVGVGADTRGANTVVIKEPKVIDETFVVEDSREGWTALLGMLLGAYSGNNPLYSGIDYSNVRPEGSLIKNFGGVASGPTPLMHMYDNIKALLDVRVGQRITSEDIVDIFNLIGKCVVSGGVRRTAEIIFGDPNDQVFLGLKNPKVNKDKLLSHRWASNNSIFAEVGMNYDDVALMTAGNGEPGYMWLENARKYSRMGKYPPDNKDYRAVGGNPCLEQTLESYELCCLVETYPTNHATLEEWQETLKYAYLYAKTVTLIPTHNKKTNSVMMRSRRIGCSISGVTQAFTKFGRRPFFDACEAGYAKIQHWDKVYSDWLGIPRSIKMTSVKPSGTVSLLAGTTPGMHYPVSQFYIRNVRIQQHSPLLKELEAAHYPIAPDAYSDNTVVVSFPVKVGYFDRSINDVSIWEQVENVAQMQEHWADNQVSVTVTFDEQEAKDIKHILELYETRLKGISFLPNKNHGYRQAPYIPITENEFNKMKSKIKPLRLSNSTHEETDEYCDGEACSL